MKEFWDTRYSGSEYVYGTAPNAYLLAHHGLYQAGQTALAVGDGEGRNGVWLASRGLSVTSVDFSQQALAKAQALAQHQGVILETVWADLVGWKWPKGEFDHVISIYVHLPPAQRRQVHQSMLEALKPGGWLLLEAFHPEQIHHESGGPREPDMLYSSVMLREDLAGAEFMELAELAIQLDEGPGHRGRAAVTRALIRRPE
ncbi:SAM-dependent methyltransferase [Ectothiorhodospira haloalkaliphila]|uniref:SAM-dependent methyltransferase n=1 Tax=Ectothiorhodospira haloalkaliphila TaxID=421628 RepID=W8KWU9_9GAMM|nr:MULTISPECIES: class I SAM-dependent methyltransferase [Ectothiorhodospira]AHK80036.1 SAM-dependent methyltransferase [Ectothiorhodospira haloalkaliphila]MCG5494450.1 class I SAM-dependent methyltransferase [Ectothiorhodospira variabilis]MCG5498903.1 class I SAM-dependent methyltransferase [Ectothiorhodospira variabilis]MCG5503179.1 class I SAM-dependent methyltransferase [Ectothiorhodospira variabilis]MCG5506062.1 class I SAM-dependent methyltransferase [Ectothiorhodospira variabilis]